MRYVMRKSRDARIIFSLLALLIALLPLTQATVTLNYPIYLGYGNGEYHILGSGTYDSIERIDGTWYVNGEVYPFGALNPEATTAANNVVANCYVAVGLISASLIVGAAVVLITTLRNGEEDKSGALLGIFLLIAGFIALVVGVAVVNGFASTLI